MRNLKFISIMSELGAGTRGASLGLQALEIAALNAKNLFFRNHVFTPVETENDLLFQDNPTPKGKNIEGIARLYNRVEATVSNAIASGQFPYVVSGDHSCAGGTIAGIKKAYPNKRLGVVWVDAHADLHSPYTTPSGNVHGMPLATAISENNEESAINEILGETKLAWDTMKGDTQRLNPSDLVFVAVRDTEEPEEHLLAKYNIPNFTTAMVKEEGASAIAAKCLDHLKDCDIIYVSFDVDSMDCDLVSRGTGTPVPGGLSEEQATNLLLELVQTPKLCCFEMVEINPCLDLKGNVMAETAFRVLEKTTEQLNK
jgi:arginase